MTEDSGIYGQDIEVCYTTHRVWEATLTRPNGQKTNVRLQRFTRRGAIRAARKRRDWENRIYHKHLASRETVR